jgi:hypothetical protein
MAKSFPGQFKKEKTSQKNGSKNKVPNALKRNNECITSFNYHRRVGKTAP